MCPAYLTHSINLPVDLANGTSIRGEHLLEFNYVEEKVSLEDMIETCQSEEPLTYQHLQLQLTWSYTPTFMVTTA